MRVLQGKAAESFVSELHCRSSRIDEVMPVVRGIVEDVRWNGDLALRKYASNFDGLRPEQSLEVGGAELAEAWKGASSVLRSALRAAEKNIREFCEWQKPKSWTHSCNGNSLGQIVRPLDSVGCYVPGGRFPLVSTLLMTVIPAQVAGVRNIRVMSPRPSAEVLAAAALLGVRDFYRIGGAQGIAAFAYGTESVPPVDKIVGPGNLYVTAAKKSVSFDCAIDMLAGPTEAVIVSEHGNPAFIAADLLAQSEHDPETLAIFITTSDKLAKLVVKEITGGGRKSQRENAVSENRSAALVARSREEAFDWANRIAPEHITIEKSDLKLVQNAGSVFVGEYSAQAAGDYASGPNHVLPTGGAARFRGGLSVMDFVKLISVQELSAKGLQRIAPAVVTLAQTEGLIAHADSIRVRCPGA